MQIEISKGNSNSHQKNKNLKRTMKKNGKLWVLDSEFIITFLFLTIF